MGKKYSGFTLIELLVVISIIGLLSTLAVVALNNARIKARDAKRKADMKQMQTALDLYYDANGAYPSTSAEFFSYCFANAGIKTDDYIPGLVPTYMAKLPTDPLPCVANVSEGYTYFSADGTGYKLISNFSPESYPVAGQPFYDPQRIGKAWMLCVGSDCGL